MSFPPIDFLSDSGLPAENLITFHYENIAFQLSDTLLMQEWIKKVILQHHHQLVSLNFIFCDDSYLHKINVDYLNHDTLTDVITFPYREKPEVEGDIFISIERVKENAIHLGIAFMDELQRVVIHGVLHLCGFSDKNPEAKQIMTQKEDEALKLLKS